MNVFASKEEIFKSPSKVKLGGTLPLFLIFGVVFIFFNFGFLVQKVLAEEPSFSLFDSQLYQKETEKENIQLYNAPFLEIEKGIVKSSGSLEEGMVRLDSEGGEEEGLEEERREIIKYIVQQGDTLSQIAAQFGLKTSTLLWSNNLQETSIIRPGDVLNIPPQDGILYTVKRGDTLGQIAKTYKTEVEKIIEFNELDSEMIIEGDELFLPDAIKPPPPAPRPVSKISQPRVIASGPGVVAKGCHQFPYGYCTWYVAQKRGCISWTGHAKSWLYNAQAQGYSVCFGANCNPAVGAIIVTRESPWGHVGYVENVSGNAITISEMNHHGWARVNQRTLYKGDGVIKGYIYWN